MWWHFNGVVVDGILFCIAVDRSAREQLPATSIVLLHLELVDME